MKSSANPQTERLSLARREGMTFLLSIAGGGVDASIILGFKVLTAAQTGNTILLAVALAERHLSTGFYAAVSVIAYVLGAAAGALVMMTGHPASRLPPMARGLLIELIPLGTLPIAWHFAGRQPGPNEIAVLVALAATAMGIQSSAVLGLNAGPKTTYVTGTLTTFAIHAVQRMRSQAAPPEQRNPHPHWLSREKSIIYGIDWLIYLCGAFATAQLFLHIREAALILPFAVVVAALVTALWLVEEKQD